jgi:hypothetical protein
MKLKYTLVTAIAAISGLNAGYSQSNIQTLAANPVFNSEAAFLNPSYLKYNKGIRINIAPLMGAHFRIANNFSSVGTILDVAGNLSSDDNANFGPANELLSHIKDVNKVQMQTSLTLLNGNFNVGKGKKQINFGVSVRQHIYSNLNINGDMFNLLYKGNKQYEDQTLELSPAMDMLSYTDFGLAASKTFTYKKVTITPAVRLRYLLGNAAMYTENSSLQFYTAPEGEYLEMNGQLNGYGGGAVNFKQLIEDGEFETEGMTKKFGKGFAFDLGATVTYKNLSFSLASIDNGSIGFKNQNGWLIASQKSSVRWEGYDVNAQESEEQSKSGFDAMESIDVTAEEKEFSTKIGSKITFNGNYGYKLKMDNKDNPYYQHNFGLSYIQGFNNRYNASTAAWTAIYYQYNLNNKLTAGINYNRIGNINDIGVNVGVNVGALNLGLGSNSVLTAINPYGGKQLDFFFQLGLNL